MGVYVAKVRENFAFLPDFLLISYGIVAFAATSAMKLKQKLVLGLCAFYLISVIGVALSLHFCGGNLSSVHLTQVAKCKGCMAAEKKAAADNCCKNTAVDAKIKDSHQSGVKVSLPKNYSIRLFLAPFLSEIAESLLPDLFSRIENKAPPYTGSVAIHIFNCVFRN